jgi:hypothetical protein
MISLSFIISNPWGEYFKNLGCLSGKITKNLAWELEHTFYAGNLAEIEFKITTRRDHAGLETAIGIFGYAIGFRIYDVRHWDFEHECWKTQENPS